MTLAPREVYPKTCREPGNLERVSHATTGILEPFGDQGLHDARLTARDRELVKHVIAQLEQHLGVDGLMFAAGGCEDAARRKRAAEEAGRA